MERQSDEYIKDYTITNLKKEIVLLEEHYREFILQRESSDKTLACKDCIEKHLLAIIGYSEEALKYLPEHRDTWGEIIQWANNRLEELPSLQCTNKEEEDNIHEIISSIKEMRLKATEATGEVCYSCQLRERQDEIDK